MTVRILENFHTVQAIVPKTVVLEFGLSFPEAQLDFSDHWFIFNHDGELQDASVERRDPDILALAAFAWRVRQGLTERSL